ncbi:hypothetical protein JG688_00016670, partial [Phytophthora aleatoria]
MESTLRLVKTESKEAEDEELVRTQTEVETKTEVKEEPGMKDEVVAGSSAIWGQEPLTTERQEAALTREEAEVIATAVRTARISVVANAAVVNVVEEIAEASGGVKKEVVEELGTVKNDGKVCEATVTEGRSLEVEEEEEEFWDAVESVAENEGSVKTEVSVGSSTALDNTIAVVADPRTSYFLPKWKFWVKDLKPEEKAPLEDSVSANIVLPLEKEEVVAAVAEVIPRPSHFGHKAFRKEAIRRVAREAAYRMLKEVREEEVPPLCDKAPDLDWERLRWHEWVEVYFAENTIPIWGKLTKRA